MPNSTPIVGERCGFLTLRSIQTVADGRSIACCTCDCGKSRAFAFAKFETRGITSCGCLPAESAEAALRQRKLVYEFYLNILAKYFDPSHLEYAKFGGAGKKIPDIWRGDDGFYHFLRMANSLAERAQEIKEQLKSDPAIWCCCDCPNWKAPQLEACQIICGCGNKLIVCIRCLEAGRITACDKCANRGDHQCSS